MLRPSGLRSLLGRAGAELSVGAAQVGDRPGHCTCSLVNDRGPGLEGSSAVEDEHLFVFIDVPGMKQPFAAEQPGEQVLFR